MEIMTMMLIALFFQIATVATVTIWSKKRDQEKVVDNGGMRSYIISCIRNTKRWSHWKETDPELDGVPPVLENLSDSELLDAYDYYCCGLS